MRGFVLFETLWVLILSVCLLAGTHIAIVKMWNRTLEKLQAERLTYDGVARWVE